MFKNVKSVVVPNTGGMRGLEAAAAIGIVAGDADGQLEVLAGVTPKQIRETKEYMKKAQLHVVPAKSDYIFDICITVFHGQDSAAARIVDYHTNVVMIRKNDEYILNKEITGRTESSMADKSLLTVKDIIEFADTVDISDVKEVLDRQISFNMDIAKEGMTNSYGANIGKVLMHIYGGVDVKTRAKAFAAAGSDARMNGVRASCSDQFRQRESGDHFFCACDHFTPRSWGFPRIHYIGPWWCPICVPSILKRVSGRLSAYCGAVGAGCGAGAGIAYLHGGRFGRNFPIRWSMAWPLFQERSVMGRKPPVPLKSLLPWTRESWDTICTKTASSLWAAMVL